MRCILLIFVFCLFSLSTASAATGLYDGKARVESQSAAARKKAASQAMQRVLVRVSGQRNIVDNDVIRNRLRQAESFIRQFAFRQQDGQLFYTASFDQQKIDQLIKRIGFPIWSNRRPLTLVWMVIEDNHARERNLLTETQTSPFKGQLQQVAEERGIKLMYPLMDLQDSLQINVDDIWGRFDDTVTLASARYPVESVLVARIYPQFTQVNDGEDVETNENSHSVRVSEPRVSDDRVEDNDSTQMTQSRGELLNWRMDWRLLDDNHPEYVSKEMANPEELVEYLSQWLADQQAERFAVRVDGAVTNRLPSVVQVMNVESLTDYVGLQSFFESMTVVSKAELLSQQGQVATFALYLLSEQQDLLNELQLDGRIKRERDEFGQPKAALEFRWNP